ncbi:hypothetical protein CMV_021440 [Castanea mollissima]|uniref:Uncharacterized protein n=1 Tax=Castanea mollissima TaxID=60419 RepID=A0A8J4QNZ5_9ROSI|nr:hypothetical protein CMV_021440 [Castanea mollissima]
MSRIHPTYQNRSHDDKLTLKERSEEDTDQLQLQLVRPSVLTVWKRSSMTFQGTDGFTVFDQHGRLAFRVDNYSRKSSCNIIKGGRLVLMDGDGTALLTLKPQVLSMQYQWNAYSGEDKTGKRVTSTTSKTPDFRIEGCFRRRNCKIIKSSSGEMVARIARKRVNNRRILLGDDVFSLAVQPGFDPQLIMAFVIILDRICVLLQEKSHLGRGFLFFVFLF